MRALKATASLYCGSESSATTTTTAPAVRLVYPPGPARFPVPASTRRKPAESSRRTGLGKLPAGSRPGTITPRPGRERVYDLRLDTPSPRSRHHDRALPAAEGPPLPHAIALST